MSASIRIGSFDEVVKVQECTYTMGSEGQKTPTFTDYRTVMASMDANSDESVSNGNLEDGQFVEMTCHRCELPGLTTRHRVVWHDTPYEITAITPVGGRMGLFVRITLHSIDR